MCYKSITHTYTYKYIYCNASYVEPYKKLTVWRKYSKFSLRMVYNTPKRVEGIW